MAQVWLQLPVHVQGVREGSTTIRAGTEGSRRNKEPGPWKRPIESRQMMTRTRRDKADLEPPMTGSLSLFHDVVVLFKNGYIYFTLQRTSEVYPVRSLFRHVHHLLYMKLHLYTRNSATYEAKNRKPNR